MALLKIEEPGQDKKEHKQEQIVVGIDLGTTNSLVGIAVNDRVRFFADEDGNELHKSVVAFGGNGEVVAVGNEVARRKLTLDNDKIKESVRGPSALPQDGGGWTEIYSIKRLMGKGYGDDSELDEDAKLTICRKKYSAEEISAEILRYLKDLALKQLGESDFGGDFKAVVTVPAYFDEAAKNATKLSAKLAGIEVLRIINEPTAAALAYGLDSGKEGIYAVYDLGGGTFDVSILKMQKGVFRVLGVSGDNELGGDDLDLALADRVFEKIGDLGDGDIEKSKAAILDIATKNCTFEGKSYENDDKFGKNGIKSENSTKSKVTALNFEDLEDRNDENSTENTRKRAKNDRKSGNFVKSGAVDSKTIVRGAEIDDLEGGNEGILAKSEAEGYKNGEKDGKSGDFAKTKAVKSGYDKKAEKIEDLGDGDEEKEDNSEENSGKKRGSGRKSGNFAKSGAVKLEVITKSEESEDLEGGNWEKDGNLAKIGVKNSENSGESGKYWLKLKKVAKKVKEKLSEKECVDLRDIFKEVVDGDCGVFESSSLASDIDHKAGVFTRKEFEEIALPFIQRSIDLTKGLIEDLELEIGDEKNEIRGVILVGGSSRIPLIKKKLHEIFGEAKIFTDLDPDRVVAQGAVIQAQNLSGTGNGSLLLDVAPLSLGVEMMGGVVDKIILRNTTIPIAMAKEFTTYADNQTGLKLHIVQGEREFAKDCRSLAEFEIKGIPPMRAGLARVLVTFKVDADGLLTVTAKEQMTGETQEIAVKPTYGIDENEVKKMLIESMQNAKGDMALRLEAEAKREARQNIDFVRRDLKSYPEFVSDKEKKTILKAADELEKVLKREDSCKDEVESAQRALEEAAAAFSLRKANESLKGYVGE